jgi:hypothetical protein
LASGTGGRLIVKTLANWKQSPAVVRPFCGALGAQTVIRPIVIISGLAVGAIVGALVYLIV